MTQTYPILDASQTVVSIAVIDADGGWAPPDGLTIGELGGNIGDVWNGTVYVTTPPLVVPLAPTQLTAAIRSECEHRINAALGSATIQASMLREVGYLNSIVATGVPLTQEQLSDAAMLSAVNAWETLMIETREALVALADQSFADDTHWPSQPVNLASFLTGY